MMFQTFVQRSWSRGGRPAAHRATKRALATAGATVALTLCSAARAEVVDAADAGFHLRIEATVAAPVDAVWRQFLAIGQWWDGEHSWFGDADAFSLDARAGGCFCEINGDRQAQHMQVSFVDPGKELRMLGGLGPLQTMGLSGVMTFRFEQAGDARTRIVHEYRVTGYAPDGLTALAPVVDAVQTHQVGRLAARFVNLD